MSSKPEQRPVSPYMLGPYYKFQITSFLSITFRLTGLFLAVVGAPLGIIWLLMLMGGPESYAAMQAFLGSFVGTALVIACLFSVCYHMLNAIRHLMWDTGRWLEMSEVRATGYLMVAAVAVLFLAILWVTL